MKYFVVYGYQVFCDDVYQGIKHDFRPLDEDENLQEVLSKRNVIAIVLNEDDGKIIADHYNEDEPGVEHLEEDFENGLFTNDAFDTFKGAFCYWFEDGTNANYKPQYGVDEKLEITKCCFYTEDEISEEENE